MDDSGAREDDAVIFDRDGDSVAAETRNVNLR